MLQATKFPTQPFLCANQAAAYHKSGRITVSNLKTHAGEHGNWLLTQALAWQLQQPTLAFEVIVTSHRGLCLCWCLSWIDHVVPGCNCEGAQYSMLCPPLSADTLGMQDFPGCSALQAFSLMLFSSLSATQTPCVLLAIALRKDKERYLVRQSSLNGLTCNEVTEVRHSFNTRKDRDQEAHKAHPSEAKLLSPQEVDFWSSGWLQFHTSVLAAQIGSNGG